MRVPSLPAPARPTLAALLVAAAPVLLSAAPPDRAPFDGMEMAQLTIHERVIIRIPRMSAPAPTALATLRAETPPPPDGWIERGRAPRCVAAADLAGARVGRDGAVDLVSEDGGRVRAKLDADCPTLDFYSGLYLKPAADGRICARRDAIRSRSGARCTITGFVNLVARR